MNNGIGWCKKQKCQKMGGYLVRRYSNLKGTTVGAYCKQHAVEKAGEVLNESEGVAIKHRRRT